MKAKPKGAGAVMANKKPRGKDDRAPWERFELFPTPPWASRAFLRQVLTLPEIEPTPLSELTAWEPCAGLGHMSAVLRESFGRVVVSDICDYGFEPSLLLHDFRAAAPIDAPAADWIITNPPFEPAADFLTLALKRARRGVAFLLRLSWLESGGRYERIFGTDFRPTLFAPYAERVPMCGGGWDVDGSTATAYAWFLFKLEAGRVVQLVALPGAMATLVIPPGCKERFSIISDRKLAARFVPGWTPPSTIKKIGKDQMMFDEV